MIRFYLVIAVAIALASLISAIGVDTSTDSQHNLYTATNKDTQHNLYQQQNTYSQYNPTYKQQSDNYIQEITPRPYDYQHHNNPGYYQTQDGYWVQQPVLDTRQTTTPVPIIRSENIQGNDGSYKYQYETGDQTQVEEIGYFLNPRTEHESLVKKGFYSYLGADGKTYTVTYWADETGFHAFGDHLPTPPPIPAAIQASLEQNAREEALLQQQQQHQQPQGHYGPQQGQYVPQPGPYTAQRASNQQQNQYEANEIPQQQTHYAQQQPGAFYTQTQDNSRPQEFYYSSTYRPTQGTSVPTVYRPGVYRK